VFYGLDVNLIICDTFNYTIVILIQCGINSIGKWFAT